MCISDECKEERLRPKASSGELFWRAQRLLLSALRSPQT
jgi:hypothetical protein